MIKITPTNLELFLGLSLLLAGLVHDEEKMGEGANLDEEQLGLRRFGLKISFPAKKMISFADSNHSTKSFLSKIVIEKASSLPYSPIRQCHERRRQTSLSHPRASLKRWRQPSESIIHYFIHLKKQLYVLKMRLELSAEFRELWLLKMGSLNNLK